MDKSNINLLTDSSLLNSIGEFVRNVRVQQNKTQEETATAAGINRSTLSQLEKGNGATLLTLVQVLRVLDQLHVLKNFETENRVSPLQLAKLELSKRKRARRQNRPGNEPGFKSSW